jgi:hypothetical protein
MNLRTILEALNPLSDDERKRFLITLGWHLTVYARAAYRVAEPPNGNIVRLEAFNEMQHQLYNYLRHDQGGEEWRLEDFLEGLRKRAVASGIDGEFGGAVRASMPRQG